MRADGFVGNRYSITDSKPISNLIYYLINLDSV